MSWSPTPPASFAPLDGRNGVPGDADALSALARRYANTAAEIEAQAANLRRLTSQARGGWKGEAGEKFVEKAGGLAERILKAKSRYEAAARALQQFAGDLGDVQSRAYDAVGRAQQAEADRQRLQANRPSRAPATATPEEASAAAAESRAHQDLVDDAATRLSTARRDYDRAVADYDHDARSAAATLRDARGREELKDSWWDRNAGWMKTALKWIGVAATILAVLALIIAVFIPGLNVAVGAFLLTQVLNGIAVGLTVVSLGANVSLWLSGNQDFKEVAEDLISLATFGVGFLAGKAVTRLASAASRIGQGIAASRAGRAAFSSRNLPGHLFDLGKRFPTTRTLLSVFPRMRRAFDAADTAAAAQRTAIQGLTGDGAPFLGRALAWGDDTLVEQATLLSRIDAAVPGVLRIQLLDEVGKTVRTLGGAVTQGPASAYEVYDGIGDVFIEPAQEARDSAARERTVQQWSMPLLQVR
jgi:uncharacterized protein YukE